jgi:molecular chaperone DnaK
MRAIGIDLGTTNSVAAISNSGQPKVLPNREGTALTPSAVSWIKQRRGTAGGEVVVGRLAVNNAHRDPENTIISIKRLMGRQYGEQRVDDVKTKYGFQLAPAPAMDVEDQGVRVLLDNKAYTPAEISAMILRQIKADAELALSEPVTRAVITVPAYFEERQRTATTEAGRLAGLEVLAVIDEPTAAALAFGYGKENEPHRLMVYDLGGGTFDISLIQMFKGNYAVLDIQGDNWLGGDDFDQAIVKRMISWAKQEFPFDPAKCHGFLIKAKADAENAKKALSSQKRAEILLPVNIPDFGMVDIDMEISREEFENDIRLRLEDTIDLVRASLKTASQRASDISAVLLVGGSTAMPLVHTLLSEVFPAGTLRRDVNPMECVALGAAIHAEQLAGDTAKPGPKVVVQQITPMHLGIQAVRGSDADVFVPIIEKGTYYPLDAPRSKVFYPTEARQRVIKVPIFEGTNMQASLNEQQGVLEFSLPGEGIDATQAIEVSFDYNQNREITVRVKLVGTDVSMQQPLARNRPRPRPVKPASLKDDWREGLTPTVRMGKVFVQGYATYLSADMQDRLKEALARAEAAIKAGDEIEGKRAGLDIESCVAGSGLASQIYVAERVLVRAPTENAKVLAQALAALRQAHAQGQQSQIERLAHEVNEAVGQVLIVREGAAIPVQPKPGEGYLGTRS